MFFAIKLAADPGSTAEPDVFWPVSTLDIEPEPEPEKYYTAADLSDEDVLWTCHA